MSDPEQIWQLGRWIGQRSGGAARLAWLDGEMVVRVYAGRIRFVEGLDTSEIGLRLGCTSDENDDLLEEARTLAARNEVTETQAMGAAKEVLQEELRSWILDANRDLELVDGEPDEIDGATVSITHTLVELVLSDTSGATAAAILPNLDVILHRSANFLDLYGPLRLSEEADLIVAKITGERTAQEVADQSPHGPGEVQRLLAALVVTGILEPEPQVFTTGELDLLPDDDRAEPIARRLPVVWLGVVAVALVIILAILAVIISGSGDTAQEAAEKGSMWTLVVDMGCQPQDLQRVLKKAQLHPKVLRPIAADAGDGEACWRLVWGSFSSLEDAEEAVGSIPAELRRDGFEPHVIELTGDELDAQGFAGEE